MTSVPGTTRARGWYYGWNIVAVSILSGASANGMSVNAFSLFLRDWSRDLHAPVSTLQLGLAALGLFSALLSPFAGYFADKYPARWLFGFGLLGLALFHLGIGSVTDSRQFIALYGILLSVTLVLTTNVVTNAVVSRWFVKRLGLALGLTSFGLGLAGVVLPPLIAVLMPLFGWRAIWRVAGLLIGLVFAPIIVWTIRDRPAERDGIDYLTGAAATQPIHGAKGGGDIRFADIFARRNFWMIVIAYLPMLALYGGCAQNLGPIAASEGLSAQTAGLMLSGFSLAQLASTLSMGLLSDRFGNRLPLFGLAVGTVIGGLSIAFGKGVLALGAGVFFAGASGGMWPLMAAAVASEFGSKGAGRAFGMLTLFIPLIGLSPFLIAKVQESSGSYVLGFAALAALNLVGAAACLFMKTRRAAPVAA
jgi:MFS family permease